ncbi:MAG: sodium:proton antiporter NhaD [Pirellula sp.]
MLSAIIVVFVLGYVAIAFEHQIHVNKAASAILTGVLCWSIYAVNYDSLAPQIAFEKWQASQHIVHSEPPSPAEASMASSHSIEVTNPKNNQPSHSHLPPKLLFVTEYQLGNAFVEIAGILFFLMGAMTIVELVDAHEGFSLVTNFVTARNQVRLLWIVGIVTFFLSSVLDNLTTTIVIVSLLRKLIADRDTRLFYVGIAIIAANAGGAWCVIGDVTTTMLWVKNKIGAVEVMRDLFIASAICLVVPLVVMSFRLKGDLPPVENKMDDADDRTIEPWHRALFLVLGLVGLMSVPVFKAFTHLPPFMGMIWSLGLLWLASEIVGHTMDDKTRSSTGVLAALRRVDMSSILFFLGILLAVSALGSVEILKSLAISLQGIVGNESVIAVIIGLVSAVVDNVPLVAAGIEMYAEIPTNDSFWMLLAYCAGTGGSCLIIGSAAGVAAMGLENINFMWYARKVGVLALVGYLAGVAAYFLQHMLIP